MGASLYRFRAEVRRTWPSLLAIALLMGIVGGVAVAAVAGARRTGSAMPRLVESTNTHDVIVNPDHGSFSRIDPDDLATLPGVTATSYAAGVFAMPADADGAPDFSRQIEPMATDGRWGYEMSRPVVRSGRMPDPAADDEILVDPEVADWYDVGAGDVLRHVVVDFPALQEWEAGGEQGPPPFEPRDFTVVGIGDFADQVAGDLEGEGGRVFYTPAFLRQHEDDVGFWGGLVQLEDSTQRAGFEAAVRALAPDEAVAFHWAAATVDRFQRSVRPQEVALWAFGAVLGAAASLGAVTSLARHSTDLANERRLAHAMGLGRRSAAVVGGCHGGLLAVVGTAAACAVAVALSPVFPIGPARSAEPSLGIHADGVVLTAAALLWMVMMTTSGAIVGARSLRVGPRQRRRPSRAASSLASLGAGTVPTLGARLAFEHGSAERAVPVVSTLVTLAVAVAAVNAAGSFGASLDRVVTTPPLYGSNWDAALSLSPPAEEIGSGADLADLEPRMVELVDGAVSELSEQPGVDGITIGSFAHLDLEGRSVPALGLDPVLGSAHPTMIEGRPPSGPDEVVLGTRTMRQLRAAVGDTVRSGSSALTVVGRAVFPGYSEYSGQDSTELGIGSWLTVEGLDRAGTAFAGRMVFVSVDPALEADEVLSGIRPVGLSDDGVQIDTFRPSEVDALQRVRSTPDVLGLALGVVGAVAASHALLSAVRRRRHDLALLRVLGFQRRQVRAIVAWQASFVAGSALIIGLPLGAALGRWSWSQVIDTLGGAASPVTPLATVALLTLAVLVGANALAAWPGRRAALLRPAEILRAE